MTAHSSTEGSAEGGAKAAAEGAPSGMVGGAARRMQLRRVDQSIAKAQEQGSRQQKEFASILVDFLRDNGQIVTVSEDMAFDRVLRGLVCQTLKMPQSCIVSIRPELMVKQARAGAEGGKRLLYVMDKIHRGRDLTFSVRLLKDGFPEFRIIVLASETDRQRFVLLHESGVDSCIVKPVDEKSLLEKLALTLRPKDQIDRALEWARSLVAQEDYLRALQVCSQALEQQAGSTAVLLYMGDIFKAMKEFDKAADAYQKAQGGSNLYLEPLGKLAELYGAMGQTARQVEYLEKMDEVSPLNLERKIQIGELALKLNQGDKARKIFDSVMKLSNRQARENVSAVAYRVADLYNETDPDMAADFLRRGLEARKEFWGQEDLAVFNRLGLILRRAGKWREAVIEYRKAITVAPNDDTLQYNLAMACLEGKDMEAARAAALKAMALNPELPRKSSRIAANLAAVFMSTNDRMHALPLLRSALEQDPENHEAKELMAKAESAS